MAKIFVTGSADGLGQLAAQKLIDQGHRVVVHAKNAQRAAYAQKKVPGTERVLVADLSVKKEVIKLAEEVNELGRFDAIIHNAGVYHTSGELILSVNTLAPYILTCLIQKPERLIYLSSQMHLHGDSDPDKMDRGQVSYSDSKLHDLLLAKAVARLWPDVYSNAVHPGWVPTKMGGAAAPDNLQKGIETQIWLATAEDARVSGRYYFHRKETRYSKEADDVNLQHRFLEKCEQITGVCFPI